MTNNTNTPQSNEAIVKEFMSPFRFTRIEKGIQENIGKELLTILEEKDKQTQKVLKEIVDGIPLMTLATKEMRKLSPLIAEGNDVAYVEQMDLNKTYKQSITSKYLTNKK